METEFDFDVLAIRKRLGRNVWGRPEVRPITGPSGVSFTRSDGLRTIIVSSSERWEDDPGVAWLHASLAVHPDGTEPPGHYELNALRYAVWGDNGWAFQVFAPESAHVNIRQNALHLWGRLDGARIHPDFGWAGSI